MTVRTLAALISGRATDLPDRPYLEAARSGRALTFAGLQAEVAGWSAHLPADRRLLLDIDNPLRFAAVYLSVLAAGRAAVPIDPDAPASDVARTVRATGVRTVITDRAERWPGSALTVLPAELPPATSQPTGSATAVPSADQSGSVLLQTSGSTGEPKLIELSEARLLHVGRAVAGQLELTASDRGYNPLPLFHINAQVVGLLATLVSGSTLVLDRRFRRTGFWPLIQDARISWINAVPAILTILSRDDLPAPISRLRFLRSASAPLPVAVRDRVGAALGVPVVESYGMTEAASQITSTGLHAGTPAGSVGRPVRSEVQIRDESGCPERQNVTGRVWIRGAGIVTGYVGGRAADRFDPAGWLDTGDLGYLDGDGNLFLAGRADDVINRGGELVYPREIEEILLDDARVVEAVVVAAPHEVLGQVPVAQLVHRPGLTPAEVEQLVADLQARCAQELSRFKRPASFAVVDSFPRASVGKIRRHLLREAQAAVR